MFNPILSELIAHEQIRDRLREAEQDRLIEAAMAPQFARRLDLRTIAGHLLIAVRHLFNASACAG
jgi:hypothetical protein